MLTLGPRLLGLAAALVLAGGALAAEPWSALRRRPGTAGGEGLAKVQAALAKEAGAIAADTVLVSWEPRLRRLVAGHAEGELGDEALFASLPLLRDKLLLAADLPAWQEKDQRGSSLSGRARYLVVLAGDPRDDSLLALVSKTRPYLRAAPAGLAGRTLDAALAKWRDHHFTREGVSDPRKRTSNYLTVLAQGQERALVEHYVRYRYWAYSQLLVLRRARGQWRVRLVVEGITQHFDRR